MNILISNDDGVYNPGILAAKKALEDFADVAVVAPLTGKSSLSRKSSFLEPLKIKICTLKDGSIAYGVSGTPADAVSIGINYIMEDKKPDLVITGINPGINLSKSEIYVSGTVSAAIESVCNGVPAIACSLFHFKNQSDEPDFTDASEILADLVKKVLDEGFPENVDLLNLNIPQNLISKDIKVTELADNMLRRRVLKNKDGTVQIRPTFISDF